jgi:hypothetical protein
MAEGIENKIEGDSSNVESKIEIGGEVAKSPELVVENKEPSGEDLLKEIQNTGGNIPAAKNNSTATDDVNQEVVVPGLVKEFYAYGEKVINKVRSMFMKGSINAKDLDSFHDQLTDKNKGEKR